MRADARRGFEVEARMTPRETAGLLARAMVAGAMPGLALALLHVATFAIGTGSSQGYAIGGPLLVVALALTFVGGYMGLSVVTRLVALLRRAPVGAPPVDGPG